MLDVRKFYEATTDGSDYTPAVRRAVDAAKGGGTIYFPEGEYAIDQVIMPRADIGLLGDGDGSKIIGNAAKPMFVWMDGTSIVRVNIERLWLENSALTGGILDHSPTSEWKRIQLSMTNVTCKYRGGCVALDLHGLVGSNLNNVDIKGGSPPGGGTFAGTAIHIKDSSTSHFWNVRMYSGICGRGMIVEGGGELWFHGSRLDGGSRGEKPGYHFLNCKTFSVENFCGEGLDDRPWLLIENCHDVWIKNPVAPGTSQRPDYNLIEIVNSHNVNIAGGRLDDQHSAGGSGRALVIDNQSSLITIRDIRFIGVFADNFSNAGSGVTLEGTEGGVTMYDPPINRINYP